MDFRPPTNIDLWLVDEAPHNDVVLSSRARLARNLPRLPFAARASDDQLGEVTNRLAPAFGSNGALGRFGRLDLFEMEPPARTLLRESHLISTEHEKGGFGRQVYLGPDLDASVMINEEDHLRLSTLVSGLRLSEAYGRIILIEECLERSVEMAYSAEFGYLTACPTNTGTGLRLSVMLHLPGLTMLGRIEEALANLNSLGLVVRGSYGEHTEHLGELFQISNEVTLGRSEQQILETLEEVVLQLVDRERQAREVLHEQAFEKLQDAVCRAIGLLSSARQMSSAEAATLLSRVRLGIGREWGPALRHAALNQLFVQIQPAHLQFSRGLGDDPAQRDLARADHLRRLFLNHDN